MNKVIKAIFAKYLGSAVEYKPNAKVSKRTVEEICNAVHPYRPNIKTDRSLREILKPTIVPFNISSIINGSPK